MDAQNKPDAGFITTQNQEYDFTNGPKKSADDFYDNSLNLGSPANGQSAALVVGGAYKGFDDWMATWWKDRILSQECGQTWLSSWQEMTWNSDYGPSNPLNYMMVETWDDYEEGTEIETGIDNCIQTSTFQPSISNGTQLTWSYKFYEPNDSLDLANMDTVDHYDLYATSDNTHYLLLDHAITAPEAGCTQAYPFVRCTTGVNLSSYPLQHGTTYTLSVEAIGVSSVTNWLSQGVSYVP